MPAYVEDIGKGKNIQLVKGNKPRVSFVGKAGFSSLREHVHYLLKNYVLLKGPQREGIYFRRKALGVLAKDPRIELRARVRKSFSAHKHTIELPPEEARQEYIQTILNSHFNLAPRGDGNYSLRFFETLAMGRVPIFIDTDAPLPLEDIISYDEFIVRVPSDDLQSLPDRVCAFFDSKSPEELALLSNKARAMFEQYLYMPKFLSIALTPERFGKK